MPTQTPAERHMKTALRVAVGSYFVATVLRLIPGTDFAAATGLVAGPEWAGVFAIGLVIGLAILLMTNLKMRFAALALGALSVLAAYQTGLSADGGAALWTALRDLVLVGALMLTKVNPSVYRPSELLAQARIREEMNEVYFRDVF